MIYLKKITEAQTLYIPRNGESVSGEMSLSMMDTTDLKETVIPVLDLNISTMYFNLAVALPGDLADGEYKYVLKAGEIVMSCGLVYIGDLKRANQHEQTITYTQYESN